MAEESENWMAENLADDAQVKLLVYHSASPHCPAGMIYLPYAKAQQVAHQMVTKSEACYEFNNPHSGCPKIFIRGQGITSVLIVRDPL